MHLLVYIKRRFRHAALCQCSCPPELFPPHLPSPAARHRVRWPVATTPTRAATKRTCPRSRRRRACRRLHFAPPPTPRPPAAQEGAKGEEGEEAQTQEAQAAGRRRRRALTPPRGQPDRRGRLLWPRGRVPAVAAGGARHVPRRDAERGGPPDLQGALRAGGSRRLEPCVASRRLTWARRAAEMEQRRPPAKVLRGGDRSARGQSDSACVGVREQAEPGAPRAVLAPHRHSERCDWRMAARRTKRSWRTPATRSARRPPNLDQPPAGQV